MTIAMLVTQSNSASYWSLRRRTFTRVFTRSGALLDGPSNEPLSGETPARTTWPESSTSARAKLSAPGDRPQRDDRDGDGSEHPDKRLGRAAGQPHLPILDQNGEQHER